MTKLERITKAIDWLIYIDSYSSRREIAEKLGYKESYFSQVLNSKVPLADKFIKNLSILNDDINLNWLLTGEGEMLKTQEKEVHPTRTGNNEIPLLPLSAQGGGLNDFVLSVMDYDCEKILSPIKADFAIAVSGDSMAPEYPSGSIVLIKKINSNAFIEWGRSYVLDTCNGSVIKKLMPGKSENDVTCVSINPNYPPFIVNYNDIYGIYRVLMCMSIK